MSTRLVYVAAAAIAVAGTGILGCDRTDLSSGDSHAVQPSGAVGGGSDYRPPSNQPGTGTGNAPTSAGSGAINGVIGNETLNWVTGPGNTESGRGTTTRPSSNAPGGTTVAPPDSGSTGGGGHEGTPTSGSEGSRGE